MFEEGGFCPAPQISASLMALPKDAEEAFGAGSALGYSADDGSLSAVQYMCVFCLFSVQWDKTSSW